MNMMADAAQVDAVARGIGYWLWGFAIAMGVGYWLLRLARSPRRRPGTAFLLRALAVLAAVFLACAGYVGGGGRLNLGGLLAIVVLLAWAIVEQRKARSG